MNTERKTITKLVAASVVTSAVLIAGAGVLSHHAVHANFAADPNSTQDGFRQIQKTTFSKNIRSRLREIRGYEDHLHRAFSYPNATQFPRYKYRGHVEVVKDTSDVVIPERCKRLTNARRARCVGIYLKEGIIYSPHKTRTRFEPKPKENHERDRVHIKYNSKGPEDKLRLDKLDDDEYYIHGEEDNEEETEYVPTYEEHGLPPESEFEAR